MKRTKRKHIVLAVVALALAVWVIDRYWIRGDVSRFETRAWRVTGHLLLRLEKPGSDVLLLALQSKPPPPGLERLVSIAPESVVYRYDPIKDELDPIGREVWEKATGPVTNPSSQYTPGDIEGGVGINYRELVLKKKGRVVSTAGKAALRIEAPSKESGFAAVLSAARKDWGPSIPFLSGTHGVGQHYHQIFSLPDLKPIGKTVRLPRMGEKSTVQMTWAPENRYVVYTDVFFGELCIIPVNVRQVLDK
jgi:hypothetical protein